MLVGWGGLGGGLDFLEGLLEAEVGGELWLELSPEDPMLRSSPEYENLPESVSMCARNSMPVFLVLVVSV